MLVLGLCFETLMGQNKSSADDYILRFSPVAMEKMRDFKIPASITLAQGLLESGNGNSKLATQANNHFGIKCHKEWSGKTFFMDDDEKNECFRSYKNPDDSYRDHSLFLTQRTRYSFLFELNLMDYQAWAKGLSKAGYATNPMYPQLLTRLIERHQLYRFDSLAMGLKPSKPIVVAVAKQEKTPSPSEFEVVGKTKSGRYLHSNNHTKLIFAKEGDRIDLLAKELNVFSWQLIKYNELQDDDTLHAGEVVYVEKKGRKSKQFETHLMQKGENLRDISQLYGVRLSRLEKINHWKAGVVLPAGTLVKLR